MSKEFSLELRAIRKKSGLTQEDVAQLLGVKKATIGSLEAGRQQPKVDQLVTLSLIYGRSFESYFSMIMQHARRNLLKRLPGLPKRVRYNVYNINRSSTLEKLRQRLEEETDRYDAAV